MWSAVKLYLNFLGSFAESFKRFIMVHSFPTDNGFWCRQVSIKVNKNIYIFKGTLDEGPKCFWPFYLQLLWFVNALPLRGIWPKGYSEQQTALVALYHCLFVILFSIFRSVRKHALPSLRKVWSCTWILLSCALIILAEMNMMSRRICPLRRLQKVCRSPQVSSIKNEVANGFNLIVE